MNSEINGLAMDCFVCGFALALGIAGTIERHRPFSLLIHFGMAFVWGFSAFLKLHTLQ